MRTSVILAVVAAIVVIEMVSIAATSPSSMEKRGILDSLKIPRNLFRGAVAKARNATRNFFVGVKNRIGAVAKKVSSFRLAHIGDAVRSASGKATQLLGLSGLVKFVRSKLGREVADLDDKELTQIVEAVGDTLSDDLDDGDLDIVDDDQTDDDAPVDDTPADDAPADDTPVDDAPADDTPVDDAPADDTPVDDAPADDAPVDDAPADDAPVDDAASGDDK